MAPVQTAELPLQEAQDCGACASRLEDALKRHRGIQGVEEIEGRAAVAVRYDPDLCSLECMRDAADAARVDLVGGFEHEILSVRGMDCYDCVQTIERAVGRMPGVTHTAVSLPAGTMRVEYRPEAVALDSIESRVTSLGYEVGDTEQGDERSSTGTRNTIVAAVLLALALAADLTLGRGLVAEILYAGAVAIGGVRIARSGLASLRATHRPDINLLMAIASVGAIAIGAWTEAALVVVLFAVGEALEGRAVDRARRELASLVALAPETARVRRRSADGTQSEVELPASELTVGDEVVVRPGERLPADGEVVEGESAVDQAAITGESTPVDKAPGDTVFAGTLNAQGLLVARVESEPGDTTLAKIGRLVAEAQERRAPSERWVDAFARVYTPVVIAAAVLVAAVPPLAFGVEFSEAFYSALALLIIACPCALVLSTPVSIVSALGRASAAGVLVKGGAYLERAAGIRAVAFDKTGTLTLGRPRVVTIEALAGDDADLLAVAAAVERGSEHPLAKAIVSAADERGVPRLEAEGFEALTGLGARARIDGDEALVGKPDLLGEGALDDRAAAAVARLHEGGRTAVLVRRGDRVLGAIGLADEPRPEAAEAVAELTRLGIERTILLTGDNRAAAEAVAAGLGLAEVRAELLPHDKTAAIEALGAGTAMVGDGVNDAPALAAADLGVAMGSAGSDTAIEVADVALMGDDPRKFTGLVGLARWTRAVVRQNVAFSLATKLAAVVLLVAGALPLWAAVASDVGASLVVVANGLRLIVGAPRGRLGGIPMLAAPRRQEGDGDACCEAPESC